MNYSGRKPSRFVLRIGLLAVARIPRNDFRGQRTITLTAEAISSALTQGYSLSDTGSDSFLGDCLFSKEISFRPEAGTPTLP